MAKDKQALSDQDQIHLATNDIRQTAEALLEHIGGLDDQIQFITNQIVEGVQEQIRDIVREEIKHAKANSQD